MLWLCGLGVAGVSVELALSRHWQSWTQGVAWLSIAALVWAMSLLRYQRPFGGADGEKARRRAAALAVLVGASGALGVWMHVSGNHHAGPLDGVYGGMWDGMPVWRQWWLAVSMRVGPSPALAPGVLALFAGMIWFLARAEAAD